MVRPDTTRLLVLGVTQIFEPANGYQLRQELLSWGVEHWAHVNPGSVYSMLSTLDKQGLIERIDIETTPGARPVGVYRMTPAGSQELVEILRRAITTVHAFDRTEYYAAMSLAIGLLERQDTVELLEQRRANLQVGMDELQLKIDALRIDSGTPPHVALLMGYSMAQSQSERDWVAEFVGKITQGEMVFKGETVSPEWKPAANDPAWRMIQEQAVYRAKLEERDAKG